MNFTPINSWKNSGGINRTSSNNIVRIPSAINNALAVTGQIGYDSSATPCINTVFDSNIIVNCDASFNSHVFINDLSVNNVTVNGDASFNSHVFINDLSVNNVTVNGDASFNSHVFINDLSVNNIEVNENIVMSGTNMNYLQFPDDTKQHTAFSRTSITATYTSTSITTSILGPPTLLDVSLNIPSAGKWYITGNYKLKSASAAQGLFMNGSTFMIGNNLSFLSQSEQLYRVETFDNSTLIFTHTISNVINTPSGETLYATVQVFGTSANTTIYGEGQITAILI
ncbi:hypothetical protein N8261_04720 [Flavobacteriaceae bacterium]|nr:hypothetical protein [Flavobacteriaceae bacterium]